MGIIESIGLLITQIMTLLQPLFSMLYGIIMIAVGIVGTVLAVLICIFRGINMSKIAKRFNIGNAWMGYLPVLCLYPMGKIAEECERLEAPSKKPFAWGKTMLMIGIIAYAAVNVVASLLLLGPILMLVMGALCICTIILIPVGVILLVVGAFAMVLYPVYLVIYMFVFALFFVADLVLLAISLKARYKTYQVMAPSRARGMFTGDVVVSIILYPLGLGQLACTLNYGKIAALMNEDGTAPA